MLPILSMEGRLAADPELRFAPSGIAVSNFRIAASSRKQVDGEWVDDKTLWMRVTAFKQLAENCAESLRKGDLVIVTGRIHTEEWETDGQKRTAVALIADSVGPALNFRAIRHGEGAAERVASGSTATDDPWAAPAGGGDEPPF